MLVISRCLNRNIYRPRNELWFGSRSCNRRAAISGYRDGDTVFGVGVCVSLGREDISEIYTNGELRSWLISSDSCRRLRRGGGGGFEQGIGRSQ